jgi:hypothetical protein
MKIINPKTTVFGILATIGEALSKTTEPAWLPQVGEVMKTVAILLMGFFAADSVKSCKIDADCASDEKCVDDVCIKKD